jgi:hypothetical protein
MNSRILLIGAVALLAFAGAGTTGAQSTGSMHLSLSEPGKVIHPGDDVHLEVDANGARIKKTLILSTDMMLEGAIPIYEGHSMTIKIPAKAKPGRYSITALSFTDGGGQLTSNTIELVIPATGVGGLKVLNSPFGLKYPGQSLPLIVMLITKERPRFVSSRLYAFESGDPAIASVSEDGLVTGQTPGSTEVTVSYQGAEGVVSTSVPVKVGGAVRGDLNDDGKVDQRDVEKLEGWIGHRANGLHDARDLDHDGWITDRDVELLKQLCTNPGCRTHR